MRMHALYLDPRSHDPEPERAEQCGGDGRDPRACRPISSPDPENDPVTGFDALYESMERCKSGTSWKGSVASYCLNGIERTNRLYDRIADGSYRPRKSMHFRVTHPREREITSIGFEDRVYQRSQNDNDVYPNVTRSFISANPACQRGKGTDYARDLLTRHMREAWRRHGDTCVVVQTDVHGYYEHIIPQVAYWRLSESLDHAGLQRAVQSLEAVKRGPRGFDPGNQTVQIVGISYLDHLDHWVKERLRVRWYQRYMDDSYLILPTMGEARRALDELVVRYDAVGLKLSDKKTRIYPIKDGITWLGYRFRYSPTGHVIESIKPEAIKQHRRSLRRMVALAKEGKLTREKVDQCYQARRSFLLRGDNRRSLLRFDRFYKSLWEETHEDQEG